MRHRQRVTILDVGALAGVHAATVSRALNRPEKVAPATRRRVEDAVKELGFVPNRAARGLITGRTDNIAVIVPDITNPHFASLVRSVERSAREAGLQTLLVDTGEHADEEVRAVRTLARDVDGFIVLSPRRLHLNLDALESKPAVLFNRPVRERASVLLRTAPAVAESLRHLASLGHTTLAYLGGPQRSWAAGERLRAVRRSSGAAGIDVVEPRVAGPTFDAAVEVVELVVRCGATAVMAFNDQMAFGVIAGLARRGISVPEDVSVVGIDDVPMAAMVAPPLTTIALPTEEAGAAAVAMLGEGVLRTELFGALVVRGSTGPVMSRRASAASNRTPPTSVAGRG
ncbi:MAG: LacI family DNA-binding transcriptional regulator [Acidimicrobiales bacterium]